MKRILFYLSVISFCPLMGNAASDLCSTQVVAAAKALADSNGTVSEKLVSVTLQKKNQFKVVFEEAGLGRDQYVVKTNGGHSCLVYSVQAVGKLTARP